MESDDPKQIMEVQRRIQQTYATPGRNEGGGGGGGRDDEETNDITKGVPLDKFMAKYTSEDNAAFAVIFEKHVQAHRRKHSWLRVDKGSEGLPTLRDKPEGDEGSTEEGPEAAKQPALRYTPKNALYYWPDGIEPKASSDELMRRQRLLSRATLVFRPMIRVNQWHHFQQSILANRTLKPRTTAMFALLLLHQSSTNPHS